MLSYSRVDLPQFPRDPHSRKEVDIPEQFERHSRIADFGSQKQTSVSVFIFSGKCGDKVNATFLSIPCYPRTMMNERVFISLEWNDGNLGWYLVLRGSSVTIHSLSSWSSPLPTRTRLCCIKACLSHMCARAPCSAQPRHCHILLASQSTHLRYHPYLLCFHSTPSCLSSLGGLPLGRCSSPHHLSLGLRMLFIEQGRERGHLHVGLSGILKAKWRKDSGRKTQLSLFPQRIGLPGPGVPSSVSWTGRLWPSSQWT